MVFVSVRRGWVCLTRLFQTQRCRSFPLYLKYMPFALFRETQNCSREVTLIERWLFLDHHFLKFSNVQYDNDFRTEFLKQKLEW